MYPYEYNISITPTNFNFPLHMNRMILHCALNVTHFSRSVKGHLLFPAYVDKRSSGPGGKKQIDSGKKTLRLNKKGAQVEEVTFLTYFFMLHGFT